RGGRRRTAAPVLHDHRSGPRAARHVRRGLARGGRGGRHHHRGDIMTTEDDYLRSVERMLSAISPEHRTAVLEDLRGHFADAEEAGRPFDEVVRGLGYPTVIAVRAVL